MSKIKKYLQVVGDVHGYYKEFQKITRQSHNTIQLGDFGFNYDCLEGVSGKVYLVGGNHDNYHTIIRRKEYLGDFGSKQFIDGFKYFFIRGGYSLDYKSRRANELITGKKSFWYTEELSLAKMKLCLNVYTKAKPSIVFSHSCPVEISETIGDPSILEAFGLRPGFHSVTQVLLQSLFDIHAPDLWIFAHFHKHHDLCRKSTRFICLSELETLSMDKQGLIL